MKIRLIGLGQCGSRVTYDFHAFLQDGVPSQDIKIVDIRSGVYTRKEALKVLSKSSGNVFSTRVNYLSIVKMVKDRLHKVFQYFILIDDSCNIEWLPSLIIGDLNPDNQLFTLLEQINIPIREEINYLPDESTEYGTNTIRRLKQPGVLSGSLLNLGRRLCGCGNYQVIGQTIMAFFLANNSGSDDRTLENSSRLSPKKVALSAIDDLSIFVYSAGGGTGSGTCNILSTEVYKTYQTIANTGNQKAVMNVVILPERNVVDHGEQTSPLQITAGRTICLLQNNRYKLVFDARETAAHETECAVFSNGNMLLSNSIVTCGMMFSNMKEAITSMNLYITSNILELTQASSKSWALHGHGTNIAKIKNDYAGCSYLLCYAELQAIGEDINEEDIKALFRIATDHFTVMQSGVNGNYRTGCGVSVPIKTKLCTDTILGNTGSSYSDTIANSTEFKTAAKVVFYVGVPVTTTPSSDVTVIVGEISKKYFVNATPIIYLYYHVNSNITLTIHIVDGFVNETYDLFIRYLDTSWKWKDQLQAQSLIDEIDKLVIEKHATFTNVMDFFNSYLESEQETYDINIFGDWNTIKYDVNNSYILSKETIAKALVQFSNQYHYG